eukprot:TRINITY_DN25433_c1_g2_i3.p3 TRINITY_DN25433_c1_g2~~TRINITY_DN25433_c1_g2_i3.p3  ORF type:complete len:109 (+),score=8.73 TRINITY_DN25433_c1_g2_i3:150-476(+)
MVCFPSFRVCACAVALSLLLSEGFCYRIRQGNLDTSAELLIAGHRSTEGANRLGDRLGNSSCPVCEVLTSEDSYHDIKIEYTDEGYKKQKRLDPWPTDQNNTEIAKFG